MRWALVSLIAHTRIPSVSEPWLPPEWWSICLWGDPKSSSWTNLDKTGGLVWASFYGSFCQRQRTRKEWKCYLFWLNISASKENWNYFLSNISSEKSIVENLVRTERLLLQKFFSFRGGVETVSLDSIKIRKVGRSKKGSVGHYHLRSAKEGRRYRTHVTNTRHGLWFASKKFIELFRFEASAWSL